MSIDKVTNIRYNITINRTQATKRRVKTMKRKHTEDTNITPGKGKQRYRVIEIGLRPAGADSERGIYEKVQFIKDHAESMEDIPPEQRKGYQLWGVSPQSMVIR